MGAQYDSELVYHNMQDTAAQMGIVYSGIEEALHEPKWEAIIREKFMTLIPPTDHKFAALHGAVWSGVMLYALRDGMFHLCYTRPRAEFVRFFGQLRALFSEEEVRTALVWGSEKIDWFADVLLRGDVRACKRGIVRALNAPLGI